jgi:hypothetical protein
MNKLDELIKLFNIIGFTELETKTSDLAYRYGRIIRVEEFNHESEMEFLANIFIDNLSVNKDNTYIELKISVYKSSETTKIKIGNFIEFLKDEFKYELRNYKINKLLQNES